MSRYSGQAIDFHLQGSHNFSLNHDEDEDDDCNQRSSSVSSSYNEPVDRIKRSQHHPQHQRQASQAANQTKINFANEPIQVKLNESYFAREQKAIYDCLANARAKLSQLQLFNPAKNATQREQQQQTWNESEKYTLDSLNELGGQIDDQFQWHRPEDGREVWSTKTQYFLAITSYSIGLGNVIRFPILVQRNGGLAFIIPFIIMLIVEGIPLFYLELAIGQRMRKAAISCWNLVSPFAAGIGIASAVVSFIIGLYYNTMVAWTLLYLWDTSNSSNSTNLPYSHCHYNSRLQPQQTIRNSTSQQQQQHTQDNMAAANECQSAGPYQYYWYRETLDASESVDSWVHFNGPVLIALCIAWTLSVLCLARGLSSSKNIVFVASLFPYVILTILFFKTVTLDGMSDGVYYLFAPQWSKLADPYMWLQAAAQVFFSLGLGFGGLIALSSYNPVNNNCYKDAIKVSMINFATSIYAGIIIFGILGFRANLAYDKCLVERNERIDFYLADYNLKVMDYGRAFNALDPSKPLYPPSSNDTSSSPTEDTLENKDNNDNKDNNSNATAPATATENDYYDSQDAILAIRSLDRRIDESIEEMLDDKERQLIEFGQRPAKEDPGEDTGEENERGDDDANNDNNEEIANDKLKTQANRRKKSKTKYRGRDFGGDEDQEFTIDVSNLISKQDLERVIEQIPDLPQCSVQRELDEATQGTGLVFVVVTEAMSHFKNARNWLMMFFLMLLTLGLDSQFGNLEGLLSSLADLPITNHIRRQWTTAFICLLSLCISTLMFAHGAGSYMFAIFDEYAASFSLVLIALFELISISYIYGLKRFCDDCELMTGKRPSFIIMISWRFFSPILLLVIIFATMHEFAITLEYESWLPSGHLEPKQWPSWCITFGAMLIIICVIWIPGVAILRILGIQLLPDERLDQCWFPAEELREFHQINEEHKITKMERLLLGFRSDDD